MPSFDGGERRRERRVDVARDDDECGPSLEQHLLDADRAPAPSARRGVPEPTPRKTSGSGRPSSVRKTSDIAGVVVLPGVDEAGLRRLARVLAARASPARTFMKFGRAPTTKQTPVGHRTSVSTLAACSFWPLALLGLARRARLDARRLPGGRLRCSRASAERRVSTADDRADGHCDRGRVQRGARDRATDRESARARLPARQARDRRHARTRRATAPRRSRCSIPASRSISNPRGGKVAAQDRAVRADGRRDRRVLGRERDVVARRVAPPRRAVRRS